ncbi:MAG: PorV/PorQ family protein [Bacteroidales bacterium]|nr:PorV/PorQ family protein [Bacteroidales bacterium]
MKKTLSYIAGALMFLMPSLAGAQALPFTIADMSPVTLAKGTAGLTETGSIAHAAFNNAAAIPFADAKMDVAAGYAMWQPTAVNSSIVNVAGAYNSNGKLGVALGFSYGMNPEYNITDASGAVKGTFKPSDMQINAGLAYRFIPALSIGANVGYATSSLAEGYSYGTVTADVFLMSQFSDFKVAAGVSNIGGTIKSASGAEFCLPGSIALGLGYDKEFAEKHAVNVNVDADYFFSGWLAASFGAGYTFNDLVSFRAGYRYGGESPIPSFASVGAGVKVAGVKIDLAYLLAGADSPMKNTLALGLGYSF